MKPIRIYLTLALALLSACASNEIVTGYDIIVQAERSNSSNPSAIADALIPHYQSSCGGDRNNPAYDSFDCDNYKESIGIALYDAKRYREASDFIINELFGSNATPEKYANSYLYYASKPFDFYTKHKAVSVLYHSLKASNDPRAKDWVITAFLFQDDYINLPIVMSDKEFLSDVDRLLGSEALREAEFYVTNIKAKINDARTANSQSGGDQNQRLANAVAVDQHAYEYAVKNELSPPYLQYLGYQNKFGQEVINME